MKIGVVGAGIIGTSIAYHLGKGGARVSIFDIGDPGSGVSSTSFACLNAFGQHETDLQLRLDAIEYHSIIAREIGGERHLHVTGTLRLASSPKEAAILKANVNAIRKHGSRAEIISPAAASRHEPAIKINSMTEAVVVPEEGWVKARALCEALIDASTRRFEVQYRRERVLGIESRSTTAQVRTVTGTEAFDCLVIAAGNDTNALLAPAGFVPLRMTTKPGSLVELSAPLPLQRLRHVIYADKLHVKPDDGGILGGVTAAEGDGSLDQRLEEERLSLIKAGSQWIKNFAGMKQTWTVGLRPMPADGRPMIGFLDEEHTIYVAVMHGGITLGPLAGRIAALEIIDGNSANELRHYRPWRSIGQEADLPKQAAPSG